jgi:TonB family protein
MTWRKKTHEEVEELRQFVEEMKRGVTTATGDSLLETLRQIHDGREAPAPAPDHRRLLLERLRREMAARDGAEEPDRPVLSFPRVGRTPIVLRWALAASLVLHLGMGGFVLSWLRENVLHPGEFFGQGEAPPQESAGVDQKVLWLPLPASSGRPGAGPKGHPLGTASGRAPAVDSGGRAVGTAEPAAPSRGAGRVAARPVPSEAAPMVGEFAATDSLAESSLAEPGDFPSLTSPGTVESFTEVLADSISSVDIDPPRIISTPKPEYPVRALADQIQGLVKVRCVFDADGKVRDVKVVRGLGYGLDEAAERAVRQIRFKPALRNGVAVPVAREFAVRFTIH